MADPILVAGAGPTGLTAALELARLGVPVRLVDRLPRAATTSRAIGVQARTLELLRQRGLADEMVRLGHKVGGVSLYGDGKRVAHIDLGRIESRYNHVLLLSQAETERVLREAAGRLGVAIERGVELVALAQDPRSREPSPVRAVLRHPDGRLEEAKAPWLISAEGAHSLVRTTLDLPFEGKTLAESYALGDLRVDADLPETDMHAFSSEHGVMVLFPMGNGRFRLIASNPPGGPRHGTEPSLDELQAVWDRRSHVPARLHDLTWGSWFGINSRMVSRLKVGRVLLGGDAADIHSPAGGQGMNTGIQDMINLGWKLAFVAQGRAPEALLDTYEQDRLPVMREVLARTEELTELIGSESPVVRGLITHLGPLVAAAGFVQRNATARISQLAVGYRGGPLSHDHAPGGSLRAGDRVPDLRVRSREDGGWSETALLDLLNPSRFTLLLVGDEADAAPAEPPAGAEAGRDLIDAAVIAAPADAAAATRFRAALGHAGSTFLVRPDGYLGLASGRRAPGDLAAYAGRWLGGAIPSERGERA